MQQGVSTALLPLQEPGRKWVTTGVSTSGTVAQQVGILQHITTHAGSKVRDGNGLTRLLCSQYKTVDTGTTRQRGVGDTVRNQGVVALPTIQDGKCQGIRLQDIVTLIAPQACAGTRCGQAIRSQAPVQIVATLRVGQNVIARVTVKGVVACAAID